MNYSRHNGSLLRYTMKEEAHSVSVHLKWKMTEELAQRYVLALAQARKLALS